jgi:predicted dehydrogenase
MRFLFKLALVFLGLLFGMRPASAEGPKEIRVGIIGLDAHGLPFTEILNGPKNTGELAGLRVVAAWPGGSADVPTSQQILRDSVEPVRKLGVEILDSVDAVLRKSDAVMILSIDGRPHLEQARATIAAGKPFFIDKPVAASLVDAIHIFELARQAGVPCFSSSSLRYSQGFYGMRDNRAVGEVLGCDAYGPNSPLEPSHPDLFYYGIHGSELLFTIMGPGCVSVSRTRADNADFVVGVWTAGRVGTLRGIRQGATGFGATVFGTKGVVAAGKFDGYGPLLVEIARFFKTRKPPVQVEQTLEIYAFMEAADESKRQGGHPVTLESVLAKAREVAASRK